MSQPTPEQALEADTPETMQQLRERAAKNQKLYNLCKRFINKHKIRSREDFAPLMDQRFFIQDIAECIGYEP